jgi:hypothetical protein
VVQVAFSAFHDIFFWPALEGLGNVGSDVTIQTAMVATCVWGEAVLFWTRAKFISPRIEISDDVHEGTRFFQMLILRQIKKKRRDKGPDQQLA